jgi:endonuclease/exonuclease/phosphatase (EEP) superfamily protein YafD
VCPSILPRMGPLFTRMKRVSVARLGFGERSRPPRRFSDRGRNTIAWICYAILFFALIGLCGRLITPHSHAFVILAAFSPYLMAPALVALIVLAIARQKPGALIAILVTLACVLVQSPLYRADGSSIQDSVDVVVLTANLRLGNADPDSLVRSVRDRHVEVLMLQELTASERGALSTAGLDELLPYHVTDARGGAGGTGLWSSFPLSDMQLHPTFHFGLVSARLHIPRVAGSPLAIAGHMPGLWPESMTDWSLDIGALPKLLQSPQSTADGGTVLFGGDFNATYDTAQFRALLTGGYHDATEQSGAGWQATYPADETFPPMIAIDHVLTRHAEARSVHTITVEGSDHRGLLVDIALPKG